MAHPRKRPPEHEEEGPSNDRWLLTYSDMITLLMVLFIVLFALGQTDIRKFNAFKDSFHWIQQTQDETPPGGPGVLSQPSAVALIQTNPFAKLANPKATSAAGQDHEGEQAPGQQAKGNDHPGSAKQPASHRGTGHAAAAHGSPGKHLTLTRAEAEMKAALQKLGLEQEVSFDYNARGLVVSILTDKILFPTDSAQLQPEGEAIINAIAPVLALLPNQIDVEGDTDNQPIRGGPYANNWALSAARAVAVVDDLIDHHGVAAGHLQATGNGATRPVVANNTPRHRAENRRVELVIFSTKVPTP
ncbi:MAG: OmpA/MotB family protein [Acidimicrobiales bacterium]